MIEEYKIQYNNLDEVAEQIRELVPSRDMQRILFGCKKNREFDKSDLLQNMTFAIRNVISMAFVLLYTRWKQIYDNEAELSPERLRRFRRSRYSGIFTSLKDHEETTLDIMVFAIIEVWVGTHVDNDTRRLFDRFFSADNECIGVLLQDALRIASIDEELLDDSGAEKKNETVCELLSAFEIFRYLDMPSDREDFFEFTYKISATKLVRLQPNKSFGEPKLVCHSGYFSYVRGDRETEEVPNRIKPYILYATGKFLDETKYLYRTFDDTMYAEFSEKSPEVPALDDPKEREQVEAMRQFLAFNYKRLRDFAIVISDAINEMPGYKRNIVEQFGARFPSLLGNPSVVEETAGWDNIISLLLVELGISEFLQPVIDDNLFEHIMENINRRYLRGETFDEIMAEYRQNYKKLEASCRFQRHFLSSNHRSLMARTVYTAIKEHENSKCDVDYSVYEESLATKYDKTKNLVEKLRQRPGKMIDINDFEETRRELEKTLRDVLCFIQVYYSGIDGYSKYQSISDFVESARETYLEIKNMSLTELYASFHDRCLEYKPDTSYSYYSLNPKATRLKKLITRSYICDVTKLEYYVTIKNAIINSNIFYFVEHLGDFVGCREYNEWLDYILDFFIFLVYNDDCTNRGLVDSFESGAISEKEIDPIYPYIVCYYSQNIDRDKVKRCDYKAYVPAKYTSDNSNEASITVTLLTEKDYDIDSNYYCMPLKYGATGSWWIDPLMIPTKVFAEILKEENR